MLLLDLLDLSLLFQFLSAQMTLGEAVDPHISPDGKLIAFVINDDLYVQAVSASIPVRLTVNGANKGVTCGLADFIAQEEMHRFRGFWWSPDSTQLAYCEADETAVPEYKILHQGKADPKHDETHHYPFAGDVNPSVRLAVVKVPDFDADSSAFLPEATWMDLIGSDSTFTVPVGATAGAGDGTTSEYYLARIGWWADGSVMAQVSGGRRAQSVLQLLRIDPVSGVRSVVLEERSSVWINLHDMVHPLALDWTPPGATKAEKDFYFVWASERSGFSQLYLYRYDAALQRGVAVSDTAIGGGGDFVVESLDAVDEANNVVYFSGNRGVAIERHLFRASLLPDAVITQLTTEPGFHNASVNVTKGFVADVFSSVTSPVVLRLHSLSDSGLTLHSQLLDNLFEGSRLNKAGMREALIPPVFRTIRSTDGQVDLHCAVYLPPGVDIDSALRLPAIMSVYGGPHLQTVRNQWTLTAELRSQRMAQQGFVVIKCDNRGSSRRGLAFEGAMHRDMGNIEVADQTAAVQHFAQAGLIDATRVGMFGWSYGGYMSAMSLCRAPDVFSCAVAGAPVTSWDGYDTHYTERYMGTPQNNAEGYAASSVMSHVQNMRGKLLLVHGLIDENVHFRHTARLINRLIECRKRYELILFPCERHSPHKAQDRVYMEDIMQEFFAANLRPEKVNINSTQNNADDNYERELVGRWTPSALNHDMLFAKYPSRGSFAPHTDGRTVHDFNTRSFYSVIIFLNDIPEGQGGGTRFYQSDAVKHLVRVSLEGDNMWSADASLATTEIHAVRGRMLIFHQSLVHEGVPPLAPHEKYIIRSDVMLRRDEPLCDSETDQQAYALFRQAEDLAEAGDVQQSVALFKRAFRLSPTMAAIMGQA
eukprot:gene21385-27415_t